MDGSLSSQEIFVMNKRGISEKMFMVGVVLYRLAKFLLSSHILANCNNWVCQYGLGRCVGWGEHHMWLGCCEAGPVFTSLLLASWLGGGGTSQTQHTTTHPDCAEPVTQSPLLDSGAKWTGTEEGWINSDILLRRQVKWRYWLTRFLISLKMQWRYLLKRSQISIGIPCFEETLN